MMGFLNWIRGCRRCKNQINEFIINKLPVAYTETDDQGQLLYANTTALISAEVPDIENINFRNYNIFDFIPMKQKKLAKDRFYKKINNKLNEFSEYEFCTLSGNIKVVRLYTKKMSKNRNIIIGVDVSKQKYYEKKLEQMSYIDPLTKIYNRNAFNEKSKEIENNPLAHLPVGIVMCDLNGLKVINDNLGHDFGDKILCEFANALSNSCKNEDLVYRIGGDEFAILIENTNENVIQLITERISSIQKEVTNGDICYTSSISVGSAIRTETPISTKDLFKEADDKMYENKRAQCTIARKNVK